MRRIVKAVLTRIGWMCKAFLFLTFRIVPIRKNKVVFTNYYGKGYGDNAKYIAEELKISNEKLDLVWLVTDMGFEMPSGIRKVQYNSIKSIFELSTSKVWIDNCRKPIYVRKRKNQYYIQTWHGDIGNKKQEKEAIKSLYRSYVSMAKNDSKMADLFITGCEHAYKIHRDYFWYAGEIATCGLPRRDILYTRDETVISKLKQKIGLERDYKYVLYAPTFRDAKLGQRVDIYQVNWEAVLLALSKKFSGQWKVLFRLHPSISNLSIGLTNKNCIDMTMYPDTQELMLISEVCISDYSSVAYEFAITGKPSFLYIPDYEEYKVNRGFAFPLEKTPYPLAETQEQLCANIENFVEEEYKVKSRAFYEGFMGMYKEGQASKFLAERIIEKCQ